MTAKGIIQWIMILVAFLLVVILAIQNHHLRTQASKALSSKAIIERYIFHTQVYRRILNKTFPIKLSLNDFQFLNVEKFDESKKIILIAFNFTTCGQCLIEELAVLHNLKDMIELKKGHLLAIVGATNEREKSAFLQMRLDGRVPYPFVFVDDDMIEKMIVVDRSVYTDTPVYFLVDKSFTVEDIFKPDSRDANTLRVWIENVLNNRYEMIY